MNDVSVNAAPPQPIQALDRLLKTTLPMGRIEVQPLPDCATLRLGLIAADFPLGPLPADVMRAVIEAPAYWAFCWGSGLGLSQLLLAEPERVQGRTVLDLGAGSGVAGIAAMRAGATRVIACDND
ncbi:MAG: methyltransferase, partial [Gammaproteobacteria bacterium]|nr:methyltransferase [Gammaproteobacteria bacterium]